MSPSPDERSGLNLKWAHTLPDITAPECYQYIADIGEMPLLKCTAGNDCPNSAYWLVGFHGCNGYYTCHVHKHFFEVGITQVIDLNGYIACEVCSKFFLTLAGTMQWRAI
jgi:hypothetical protein